MGFEDQDHLYQCESCMKYEQERQRQQAEIERLQRRIECFKLRDRDGELVTQGALNALLCELDKLREPHPARDMVTECNEALVAKDAEIERLRKA